MFSLNPFTPGRRQQMPRTLSRIFTPAREAAYSASISSGSASEFIFASMPAGSPWRQRSASASISSRSRGRMPRGAASTRRNFDSWE